MGLEELLQAGSQDRQLLRVKVFLWGEGDKGGKITQIQASLPLSSKPWSHLCLPLGRASLPSLHLPSQGKGWGRKESGSRFPGDTAGGEGSELTASFLRDWTLPHLQDLIHNFLHDLTLGFRVTAVRK